MKTTTKVLLALYLIFIISKNINAQDIPVNLDLLKAPTSPGFILLNKQPSDIERPTSPTDFMVSLSNASQEFTAVPRNYAVEVAPCWLFGGSKITFADAYGPESNKNIGNNIIQSLTFSTAVSSGEDDLEFAGTQLGFGVKFSILRGIPNEEFTKSMDSLKRILKQLAEELGPKQFSAYKNDPAAQRLEVKLRDHTVTDEEYEKQRNEIARRLNDSILATIGDEQEIKAKKFSNVQLQRIGWFLDFAGGTVVDFPTQTFDDAQTTKAGAWLTGGYEGAQHLSILFLGRWLYEKNVPYLIDDSLMAFQDNNSLDFGGRLAFDRNRFSLSGEALFRSNLGIAELESGWRGTFYLGYDIGNNKVLSFNITRDFDGTVNKEGTLITALNLILGFGSTRNLQTK